MDSTLEFTITDNPKPYGCGKDAITKFNKFRSIVDELGFGVIKGSHAYAPSGIVSDGCTFKATITVASQGQEKDDKLMADFQRIAGVSDENS